MVAARLQKTRRIALGEREVLVPKVELGKNLVTAIHDSVNAIGEHQLISEHAVAGRRLRVPRQFFTRYDPETGRLMENGRNRQLRQLVEKAKTLQQLRDERDYGVLHQIGLEGRIAEEFTAYAERMRRAGVIKTEEDVNAHYLAFYGGVLRETRTALQNFVERFSPHAQTANETLWRGYADELRRVVGDRTPFAQTRYWAWPFKSRVGDEPLRASDSPAVEALKRLERQRGLLVASTQPELSALRLQPKEKSLFAWLLES
jgi:hypothetical protein